MKRHKTPSSVRNSPTSAASPFPGLVPFQETDAGSYFGRRGEAREFAVRWEQDRFQALLGPDGIGKASFVQAGAIPALQSNGGKPTAGRWWKVCFRIESAPLRGLAEALSRAGRALRQQSSNNANLPGDDFGEEATAELRFLEATLRSGNLGLVRALQDQGLRPDDQVVVWLEHAEDLAATTRDSQTLEDAQTLTDLLLTAANQSQRNIHVVASLGERPAALRDRFPEFLTAIEAHAFELTCPSIDALRATIVGPLKRAGASVDDAFLEQSLKDVAQVADPLPRLQHFLSRAWRLARARAGMGNESGGGAAVHLSIDDYRRAGGVEHAIRDQFCEIIDELSNPGTKNAIGKSTVIAVLQALRRELTPSREGRLCEIELQPLASAAGVRWEEAARVVSCLSGPDFPFLAHDALDAESLIPETLVTLSQRYLARLWPESFERPVARVTSAASPAATSMNTSDPAANAPKRSRHAARSEASPAGVRKWRPFLAVWLLAVVATLSVAGVQWMVEDWRQRRIASESEPSTANKSDPKSNDTSAGKSKNTKTETDTVPTPPSTAIRPLVDVPQGEERRRVARAERSVALAAAQRDTNPVLSLLLAAEAARSLKVSDRRPEALDQVWRDAIARCTGRALAGHPQPVRMLTLSPDERWAVTVADTIRLWDLQTTNLAEIPLTLAPPVPGDVAARADVPSPIVGVRFVSAAARVEAVLETGEVWSWSVREPAKAAEVERLADVSSRLKQIAFRPGHDDLATCDERGAATLWRRQLGEAGWKEQPLAGGGVRSVSFDASGSRLATAGGLVQIWNVADEQAPLIATLLAAEHQEFVRASTSVSGRWVAAVDATNNVFLWDLNRAAPNASDIVVDSQPRRAEGRTGVVTDLTFDPQDRYLAIAADDRAIHAWPLDATATDAPRSDGVWVLAHPAIVRGMSTSGDGRWLFSTSDDGAVRVWEMPPYEAASAPVATWPGVAGRRGGIVASSPGTLLATVDGDGQARLWDTLVATDIQGQFLLPPGHVPDGNSARSTSGDRVALVVRGGERRQIVVWRTNDPRGWIPETGLELPAEFADLAFSLRWDDASETLAAVGSSPASDRKEIALWRLPSLKQSREVGQPFLATSQPRPVAFRLSEPFVDFQFGPSGLLLLGATGRLRAWKFDERDNRYVERDVPPHKPARAVRVTPAVDHLALVHTPSGKTSQERPSLLVSLWGPESAPNGAPQADSTQAEWTEQAFWELPAPPGDFDEESLAINSRWLVVRAGKERETTATQVRGWRIDVRPPREWHIDAVDARRFRLSSTGDRLLVEGRDEARVYVLDDTPRLLHSVRYAENQDAQMAWSGDGRWLARTHASGGVELWDLARVGVTNRVLLGATLPRTQLFFTRGDRWLVGFHPAGYVSQWPCVWDSLVETAQRAVGRNLTMEEWTNAFPEERDRFEATFGGWGPGRVAQTPRWPDDPARRALAARPPLEDGVIRIALESLPTLGDGGDAAEIVRDAVKQWSETGVVAFREVASHEHPHLVVRTERLDGPGGVPGHGQLGPPQEGLSLELRLDAEADWKTDLLRLVAVHELGHLLGLTHTATPGQLMSESVPDDVRAPQEEDISRLRQLWMSP